MADGVPDGLRIASLRRRHLAALINVGVALSGCLMVVASVFGGGWLFKRRRDDEWPTLDSDKWGRRLDTRQARIGIGITDCAAAVLLRNRRGPGMKVAGIRRVDARTGGPITPRSALTEYAVGQAWMKLNSWMLGPLRRGSAQRAAALSGELKQIRERYADDSEARMRAQMDLYKERNVNPFASCGWQLPSIVAGLMVIVLTPRHQSLPDLIAGIITVES